MNYIFFTDLRSSKIAEAQKVVPKGAQHKSCRSHKVVPKGAQCKFYAQKSFLRECRAKYHRNIRRSAKSQREKYAEI
jgi:hypothetical protein